MGSTEQLARFVRDTGFQEMPGEAISRAKEMFLDTIGVALAGTLEASGRIAIRYAKEIGGTPEASVLGGGLRTSAPMAAFTNALLAHNMIFDDTLTLPAPGHPSCMMVAVPLALGEKLSLSGRAVLEAYVLGIEVYTKILGACPNAYARGWDSMSIYGCLGAAAAAAKLLGLDIRQTSMAFGVAASAASGVDRPSRPFMTDPFQAGNAARSGLEAALLAREGFTASNAIIECPSGFCDVFFGEGACDYEKMTRNLGKPFHIVSPGLGMKLYPCSMPTRCAADAILELRREHAIAYEDVQHVEVSVSPYQYERFNVPEPKSGWEARIASLNFVCASALLDGRLGRDTFSDAKLQDTRVKDAVGKVKLIVDESRAGQRDSHLAPVRVKLKDGTEYSKRVDVPRGYPRNPLAHSDILAKYRENAGLVLPEEHVVESIRLIENLEHVEDLRELMDILRQGESVNP